MAAFTIIIFFQHLFLSAIQRTTDAMSSSSPTSITCPTSSSTSSSSDILLALVAVTVVASIGNLVFNVVQMWEFLRKYFSRKKPDPVADNTLLFGPADRRLLTDIWTRIMNDGSNSLWNLPVILMAKIDYLYNFTRRQNQSRRQNGSHWHGERDDDLSSRSTTSGHAGRKHLQRSLRKAKTFACDEQPIQTIHPRTSFQDDLELGFYPSQLPLHDTILQSSIHSYNDKQEQEDKSLASPVQSLDDDDDVDKLSSEESDEEDVSSSMSSSSSSSEV